MSSGGAFGGSRGLQPKPPERGVFPLDHFGECKEVKDEYMKCLKDNRKDAQKCRDVAKKYLECRMSKNLMAQEDLSNLGFKESENKGTGEEDGNLPSKKRSKDGFVAGMPRR